jgi:hypothetical protein
MYRRTGDTLARSPTLQKMTVFDRDDDAAWGADGAHSDDAEGGGHGLASTDAFEDGVDADPAGHVQELRGDFIAAFVEDVGRAELAGECLARGCG